MAERAVPRLAADVLGPRVKAEHAEDARPLLARVRVLTIAGTPAERLEERAIEALHEASEGGFGALPDRVVGQPTE